MSRHDTLVGSRFVAGQGLRIPAWDSAVMLDAILGGAGLWSTSIQITRCCGYGGRPVEVAGQLSCSRRKSVAGRVSVREPSPLVTSRSRCHSCSLPPTGERARQGGG